MIVYDYFRSSAAFRLRIALNLKGLVPDRRYIHLANNAHRTDEYLAVNPQGLVPYMIDDDGFELSQSLAIIEYLDETHPEPPLMPTDTKARAFARSVAQIIACDIHPVNNKRILDKLEAHFRAKNIPEPLNQVLLLTARFNQLRADIRAGTVLSEHASVEMNKIRAALLDLIRQLD